MLVLKVARLARFGNAIVEKYAFSVLPNASQSEFKFGVRRRLPIMPDGRFAIKDSLKRIFARAKINLAKRNFFSMKRPNSR